MQHNEQATFEKLLRPHMERLYRLALRLTSNKADAEDLFQDVLVKAFARLDELLHIDHPGSWLSRVLYNHFVDNHRRFTRQRMVLVEEGRAGTIRTVRCAGDEADRCRSTPERTEESSSIDVGGRRRGIVFGHTWSFRNSDCRVTDRPTTLCRDVV